MTLQDYQLRRLKLLDEKPKYRNLCCQCLQPEFGCYCEYVQPFDTKIKFVILIHPIEVKRRIATGRMSYLCLKNSELITGQDYTHNSRVNEIVQNPKNQPYILYPGRQSLDISKSHKALFEKDKMPVIFVIDGTWATARKTMHQSQNLKSIRRISFVPPGPSQFRVRKQPAAECYSTIEAIHHSIELLGDTNGREHDKLLFVFDKMVERQLEFIRRSRENPEFSTYRRDRKPDLSYL